MIKVFTRLKKNVVRDFQDPMEMTLAKKSNTGKVEPYPVDRHSPHRDHPPIWKNFTQNCFCLKKIQGLSGAETEGKVIQRLPHRRIHPICRHQTQTLWLMSRSAYWQEPDIAVPWEARPKPDQYRCGVSQPTIVLSTRTPRKELRKDWRSWKVLQPHRKNNID